MNMVFFQVKCRRAHIDFCEEGGKLDLCARSRRSLDGRDSGLIEPGARSRQGPVTEDGRSLEYGPAEYELDRA